MFMEFIGNVSYIGLDQLKCLQCSKKTAVNDIPGCYKVSICEKKCLCRVHIIFIFLSWTFIISNVPYKLPTDQSANLS